MARRIVRRIPVTHAQVVVYKDGKMVKKPVMLVGTFANERTMKNAYEDKYETGGEIFVTFENINVIEKTYSMSAEKFVTLGSETDSDEQEDIEDEEREEE